MANVLPKHAASRIYIALVGMAFFALCSLNFELGQREAHFTAREWSYFAFSVAGVALIVLSAVPSSFIRNGWVIGLALVPVTAVEIAFVFIVWRNAHRMYLIQEFGMGIVPGSPTGKTAELGVVCLLASVVGLMLAAAVNCILRKANSRMQASESIRVA